MVFKLTTLTGLDSEKVKKLAALLDEGDLPEPVIQCLIDHGINCTKYMDLNSRTLNTWIRLQDEKPSTTSHNPSKLPSTTSHDLNKPSLEDIQIKEEPIELSDLINQSQSNVSETNSKLISESEYLSSIPKQSEELNPIPNDSVGSVENLAKPRKAKNETTVVDPTIENEKTTESCKPNKSPMNNIENLELNEEPKSYTETQMVSDARHLLSKDPEPALGKPKNYFKFANRFIYNQCDLFKLSFYYL